MDDIHYRGTHPLSRINPALRIMTLLLLILPGWVGDALASPDDRMTTEQLRQLKQGTIIVETRQEAGPARGMVEAAILIEAPTEIIWEIMVNCDEIPTYVPGVELCEVLESGENWQRIRHELKWIWLFPRISYVFLAQYTPNQMISFTRVSGDLKEMRGSWRLDEIDDNTTIVRYRVYLDPGFLVPQWLVRSSLKSDLPEVLKALRDKVLSRQTEQNKQ